MVRRSGKKTPGIGCWGQYERCQLATRRFPIMDLLL